MRLNGKNFEVVKKMVELLCFLKEVGSGMIILIFYIVWCGGVVYYGYLSDFGCDIWIKIFDFVEEFINMGV